MQSFRNPKGKGGQIFGFDIGNVYSYLWPGMIRGDLYLPIQVLGEYGAEDWR